MPTPIFPRNSAAFLAVGQDISRPGSREEAGAARGAKPNLYVIVLLSLAQCGPMNGVQWNEKIETAFVEWKFAVTSTIQGMCLEALLNTESNYYSVNGRIYFGTLLNAVNGPKRSMIFVGVSPSEITVSLLYLLKKGLLISIVFSWKAYVNSIKLPII